MELVAQTLDCLARLVAFLVPCQLVLGVVYAFAHAPSYVFRKLLHVVAFTGVTLMVLVAKSWQAAALAAVTVAVVAYPVLAALESRSWFAGLFVQKSPGEVRRSLLMLFFMFAAIVAVAWGLLGRPELAACAILMWGTGDGIAALVGIPFGRHKVRLGVARGKKSWEGSAAMLAVSCACGCAVLLGFGYAPGSAVVLAVAGALVGTAVELLSASELDTVTVPVAILATLALLGCAWC